MSLRDQICLLPAFALVLGFALPAQGQGARAQAAEAQIQALSASLDAFKADCGRYPSTEEGLSALVNRPSTVAHWRGPYITTPAGTKDPWGDDYVYHAPGIHNTQRFDLYSTGAHPTTHYRGGEDEWNINNWDASKPWRVYYGYSRSGRSVFAMAAVLLAGFLSLVWLRAARHRRAEAQ